MATVDVTLICDLLRTLSDDLRRSKNKAYEFIDSLINELSTRLTQKKITAILTQIKSSAKMVEYANFTKQQEEMWMKVWIEATRLLEK